MIRYSSTHISGFSKLYEDRLGKVQLSGIIREGWQSTMLATLLAYCLTPRHDLTFSSFHVLSQQRQKQVRSGTGVRQYMGRMTYHFASHSSHIVPETSTWPDLLLLYARSTKVETGQWYVVCQVVCKTDDKTLC